jgi:hypothetical protein
MEQVFIVVSGTVVTVLVYIMSPVRLSEWVLGFIERLGKGTTTTGCKPQAARNFYVRNLK